MLHFQTITRETHLLLKAIMHDSELVAFNLVGGTALALYLGHRSSIDLDLFTKDAFDVQRLQDYLIDKYNFKQDFIEKNTLKGSIEGIKVYCITHNYPFINPVFIEDEIRLLSLEDIAAMKLSAITYNGTRLKDFIDIAYLSTKMSLNNMLDAYNKKFINANKVTVLKALSYFEDINFKEHINLLKGNFEWNAIEKRLSAMIKNENKIFSII